MRDAVRALGLLFKFSLRCVFPFCLFWVTIAHFPCNAETRGTVV